MTTFLALCVGLFSSFVWVDLLDLKKEASRANWVFLIFNTGMLVFAVHALWERF